MLAAACGLIVANLYYAQPLVGPIGASLGLPPGAAGVIVTMTQIGYGLGLLVVVPLGDLVENRALVLTIIGFGTLAVISAGLATHAVPFLASALLIGLGSVAVQVLVPYAANLAPEASRGRVVGNVMSGLMLGIMLARPIASVIANASSWHVVFFTSACVMVVVMAMLGVAMPTRRPVPGLSYSRLLLSMAHLVSRTSVLRRRGFYHAFLFGSFSLFWTAVPLLLVGRFHLSQNGIALFALAGVAGAISAPFAGRAADAGWTRPATAASMGIVAFAFLVCRLGEAGTPIGLALLVVAAIMLDFGVTAHLVLSQRAIFSLDAEYRSRLNGLFMAFFFCGGAAGSALGGWTYAAGGWSLTAATGLALPLIAFGCYLTEFIPSRKAALNTGTPPRL